VPAFEHKGFSIYESNAIAHYVDDAFPGPRLPPRTVRSRGDEIVYTIGRMAPMICRTGVTPQPR
jgi:glutathione S-transferase